MRVCSDRCDKCSVNLLLVDNQLISTLDAKLLCGGYISGGALDTFGPITYHS